MNGPTLADLDRKLPQADTAAATVSAETAAPSRSELDRSLIGRYVVRLYCGVIVATLLVLLGRGALVSTTDLSAALDLIKTAVLPVVTLVIGYYFGKSERTQ